ncbi:MAG: molybdopterin-guanine dinucleotide biosynthesis protein A [Rhodospirillaceae bacterium]|jgi:hypothetical protein|nr:molybdopterin-guanine dinucleotide biosynthesis protein A [Rhodospirillaceae bacterium]MBT5899115.1 molybdopterin-guanine dinucleotide biosynthesis protein A [Rhodospirillaceae bacterium]MBT6426175.1 molybdopterin-guanine dinucleotide biosynthesis protein A [Rhodospirillaceae bacterium]
MPRFVLLMVFTLSLLPAGLAAAAGGERHTGYYYPAITSEEVFRARAPVTDTAGREMRVGFIVAQTKQQQKRAYPPRYAIFAKGDEAEKMIIVGLDGHSFATLYRARGVLAQLTASARASALFRNLAVEDIFTFFDLARMLGFERITVSDGKTYSHRIELR